jgi:hypothetical protein
VNSIPAAPLITLVGANLWSNIQTGNQWYRENNPISGATGQSYSPIMEGIYWNVVTGNGCMSDTSNHLYWTSVGLNEITTSQIEIYPVPNDGHFTVSISSPKPENFTIIIYSNIGIKIYEAKDILVNGMLKKFFDLRPAPNGFYYVELKTNNKVMISKMIINK